MTDVERHIASLSAYVCHSPALESLHSIALHHSIHSIDVDTVSRAGGRTYQDRVLPLAQISIRGCRGSQNPFSVKVCYSSLSHCWRFSETVENCLQSRMCGVEQSHTGHDCRGGYPSPGCCRVILFRNWLALPRGNALFNVARTER